MIETDRKFISNRRLIEHDRILSLIEIDRKLSVSINDRNWYKHSLVETDKSPLVSYHFVSMIETDGSLSSIPSVIKI